MITKEDRELVTEFFRDYSLYDKPERMSWKDAIYQSNAMYENDCLFVSAYAIMTVWNELVEGSYSNE